MSIPYALNAKMADSIQNYMISTTERTEIASDSISSSTVTTALQLTNIPTGTYAVYFSSPIRNQSTSNNGINHIWAVTANKDHPAFPVDGIANLFIPSSGWSANYPFGQSGHIIITLDDTGSIELKLTYYGALITGSVKLTGTTTLTAIRL